MFCPATHHMRHQDHPRTQSNAARAAAATSSSEYYTTYTRKVFIYKTGRSFCFIMMLCVTAPIDKETQEEKNQKTKKKLSPVSGTREVDVEVKDTAIERTPESLLVTVLPLLVDDLKRDVLVRRARVNTQDARFAVF